MKTFLTPGRRPVKAETINEAAQLFAARMARAEFGKRGDCRTCTMGSYAGNGSMAEFHAFIGITKNHETTGHNVQFSVYVE